jgi:ABC-type polysaccharide/polyol phosphate transport system ATPase subunit
MTDVLVLDDLTLEYPLPKKYRKEDILPSGIRNITFSVKEGEVIGIVGRNGSGKSTLLKLMAGVFPPDNGTIALRGSVSLLAGVGVGFHKDLTGRENAYLYGALMGRTQTQIDRLIDEIQDFAELKHHFDRPLRTYSSGMKSRLGISVATAFKPDLLLIDEVLGVGDASFREKSQQRVKQLIKDSGSVVIVSHSMGLLKSMCTSLAVIEDGNLQFFGDVEEGLKIYSSVLNKTNLSTEDEYHKSELKPIHSSFKQCIQQSINSWRDNPHSVRSKLISKLNKKIPMKLFMEKNSHIRSNLIGRHSHISEIDFDNLPDEFVIKPQDGASNNGVFVIKRNDDNTFFDAMRGRNFTPDQIVAEYLDEHKRFKSINLPVYIEERYTSADPNFQIPLDYKGYCFNGRVELIMQRNVNPGRKASDWRFAYYDRDWNKLGSVREGIAYGQDLQPPRERIEIVREMERLSKLLPLEFCSMDMYNTLQGVAFGECTIHPGAYKAFSKEWDMRLGERYASSPKVNDERIIKFLDENSDVFK